MFGRKKYADDPKKALDRGDKVMNKGLTGKFTRMAMGKDFVERTNQAMDQARKAVDDRETAQQLAQNGMPGKAEVLSLEDTGKLVNFNPVLKMQLKVQPQYGMEFETAVETMVSKVAIPRIGDTVNIMYNPANPTQLTIV